MFQKQQQILRIWNYEIEDEINENENCTFKEQES